VTEQYNQKIEIVERLLRQRYADMIVMLRMIDFISPWEGFEYPLKFVAEEISRPVEIGDVSSITILELMEDITFLQESCRERLDRLGTIPLPERIDRGMKLLAQLQVEKEKLTLVSKLGLIFRKIKNRFIVLARGY
jgi:hypothetical protein